MKGCIRSNWLFKNKHFCAMFSHFHYSTSRLILIQVGLFVHQFIEGKLITNWKYRENNYVEIVPKESNFKTDINLIFCLTSSTDKYYVTKGNKCN